jgi:hypothetical protein
LRPSITALQKASRRQICDLPKRRLNRFTFGARSETGILYLNSNVAEELSGVSCLRKILTNSDVHACLQSVRIIVEARSNMDATAQSNADNALDTVVVHETGDGKYQQEVISGRTDCLQTSQKM